MGVFCDLCRGRCRGRGGVNNGALVVFCSKEETASELEAELKSSGKGAATYVSCDVTKEEEIKRLIDVTVKTYRRIDCLINNAGWHPPEQIIDNTSAQEFQDLLNLNLIGYFLTAKKKNSRVNILIEKNGSFSDASTRRENPQAHSVPQGYVGDAGFGNPEVHRPIFFGKLVNLMKYALPHLRKAKGNIINISSLVGIIGQKHAIPYVATKGAVTAMTKAMAVDESQYNVRVNSISPGNIWTPLWEELSRHSTDPAAMILGGKDAQLLGRMGTVEECANAALFLAAEGTFCTGIDILLTGGAELNYANKNQQETRSSIYH